MGGSFVFKNAVKGSDTMKHEIDPYVFSGAVAALAQALMYWSRTARGEPFSWPEFLSAVAVASLMGVLICMAAHSYGLGYELGGALAGLGGMIGKEAVSIAVALLKKRSGLL